jgi:hypothetical protein
LGAVGFRCTGSVAILFLAVEIFRQKKWKRFGIIVLTLCFVLSAVLIDIVFGRVMPYRTESAVLLFCGGVWFLFYNVVSERRILKWIACIIAILLIFQWVAILNMMFYSANVRYKYDLNMGTTIFNDIVEMTGELPTNPVIFLGKAEGLDSNSILRVEHIGLSYFEMDNTYRISYFMKAHGYNLTLPANDLIEAAKVEAVDLPSWPNKDSILIEEDKIIVKLSDY